MARPRPLAQLLLAGAYGIGRKAQSAAEIGPAIRLLTERLLRPELGAAARLSRQSAGIAATSDCYCLLRASYLRPGAGLLALEDRVEDAHLLDGVLDAVGQRLLAEHGEREGLGLLGVLVDRADDLAAGQAAVERGAGVDR